MIEPTTTSSRSFGLLLALTVTALGSAVGGCAHDDYYCDNTGCFICDGVGCRPVNPPTRPTCQGDWDCAAGQVCTSAGCATGCHHDSDCASGWICRGGDSDGSVMQGLCVAPSETTPTPNPGTCTSNAQCHGGEVCINGACGRTTMPTCTADSDCPAGNVCLSGRCTASANTCQFNSQCGQGRVCVNSQCEQSCGTGLPACATGLMCDAQRMYCVPASSSACVHDADCGTGQRCLDSVCYQSCVPGSATCGSTALYCSDDGVCVPDTRPRPFCTDDHGCAAGSSCVGGFCRVPCSTNLQCQMRDVTYRNCGQIPYLTSNTNTYCLTDDEYRPVCARQSDCSATQACIDGICR